MTTCLVGGIKKRKQKSNNASKSWFTNQKSLKKHKNEGVKHNPATPAWLDTSQRSGWRGEIFDKREISGDNREFIRNLEES